MFSWLENFSCCITRTTNYYVQLPSRFFFFSPEPTHCFFFFSLSLGWALLCDGGGGGGIGGIGRGGGIGGIGGGGGGGGGGEGGGGGGRTLLALIKNSWCCRCTLPHLTSQTEGEEKYGKLQDGKEKKREKK